MASLRRDGAIAVVVPDPRPRRSDRTESLGLPGVTAVACGLSPGYGLHLYQQADSLGFIWTGHNGGVEGGISNLSDLPDDSVGYAFQTNTANGAAVNEFATLVRSFVTHGLRPRTAPPPTGRVGDRVGPIQPCC